MIHKDYDIVVLKCGVAHQYYDSKPGDNDVSMDYIHDEENIGMYMILKQNISPWWNTQRRANHYMLTLSLNDLKLYVISRISIEAGCSLEDWVLANEENEKT